MSERHIRNRKRHYDRIFEQASYKEMCEDVIYPGPCDFDQLVGLERYPSPNNPGFAVSQHPLLSYHYYGCNGVAILTKSYSALSHYNICLNDAGPQLKRMIKALKKRSTLEDACAVLIGGNRSHALLNEEILRHYNIPLLGTYIDGQGNDNTYFPQSYHILQRKDVLVLPKNREVIVQIHIQPGFDSLKDLDAIAYISFKCGRTPRRFV